jgi:Tol biopolymer transport system component
VYQGIKDATSVLMKVSVDGGDPIPLTEETAARPIISPDGQWIACFYFDQRVKPSRWQLALLPFSGGPPKQLFELPPTADRLIAPRWTSEGQSITYVDTQGGTSNLWQQPITGGAPEQITHFRSDLIFNFAWSQDGQQLVFARGSIMHDVVKISAYR